MAEGRASHDDVLVTGVGCVTALGHDLGRAFRRVVDGEPAFAAGAGGRLLGAVDDRELVARLPSRRFQRLPRYSQLVAAAAAACLRDAGLERLRGTLDPARVAVVLGTNYGPQEVVETISWQLAEDRPRQVNPVQFQETVYNAPLGHLSIHYGITGPCVALSNGTASGLQAVEVALGMLRGGGLDLALVGGVDSLTETYLRGLADARILSPRDEIAPFAATRSGVVAAEGGVFLALEQAASCRRRDGESYARLEAAVSVNDAFSHYGNEPSGEGFRQAIELCLAAADLSPRQVGLILAYASGTRVLDRAEWRGIGAVWGEHAGDVPVTSIKGVTGDMGAATQLLALGLCREIFEHRLVPATVSPGPRDPECRLRVLDRTLEQEVATVLVNEASWGGINASVILSRL